MARSGTRGGGRKRAASGTGTPNMLVRLRSNIKSCDGEPWEVELGAFNAVVGPTGSGKSAITQAIQLLYSGACDDVAFRARSRDLGLIFADLAPPGADEMFVEGWWDNGANGHFRVEFDPSDGSYHREHKLPPGVSKGDKDGCPHLPIWSVLDVLSASGPAAQLTVASWLLADTTDDDVQDALDAALPAVAAARQISPAKLVDLWAWGKQHFAADDDRTGYYALAAIEDAAYDDAQDLKASRKGASATANVVASAAPSQPPPSDEQMAEVEAELATLRGRLQAARDRDLVAARTAGEAQAAAHVQTARQQHAALAAEAQRAALILEQTALAVATRRDILATAEQALGNTQRAADAALAARAANRPPIEAAVKLVSFAIERGHDNCPACGTAVGHATLTAVRNYYANAPALTHPPEMAADLALKEQAVAAAQASVNEATAFEAQWVAHAVSLRERLSALAPILAAAGSDPNDAAAPLPGGVPATAPPVQSTETESVAVLEAFITTVQQRHQAMQAAKQAWSTAARAGGVVDEHDARIERDEHVVALVSDARARLITARAQLFAQRVQEWLPAEWPVTVETEHRGRAAFRLRLARGGLSGGQGLAMVAALARVIPGPSPQCLIGFDRLLDKESFKGVVKALKTRGKAPDQIVLTREDAPKLAGVTIINASEVAHLGRPALAGEDEGEGEGEGEGGHDTGNNGVDPSIPAGTPLPG